MLAMTRSHTTLPSMLLSQLSPGMPEIFASVQGEGVSMGVPAVFVRLAECNLRCDWCDTKYTWDWANHDRTRETIELSVSAVAEQVVAQCGGKISTVIATGGEPLLQQPELAALAETLHRHDLRIEVETNGAIEPTAALAAHIDQWNVSPKLANSGNALTARIRAAPLTWFAQCGTATFKFVVAEPSDLEEIEQLVAQFALRRDRVLAMPEAVDADTIVERGRWLAHECTQRGFRLTTRLHVLLWGSTRGR